MYLRITVIKKKEKNIFLVCFNFENGPDLKKIYTTLKQRRLEESIEGIEADAAKSTEEREGPTNVTNTIHVGNKK